VTGRGEQGLALGGQSYGAGPADEEQGSDLLQRPHGGGETRLDELAGGGAGEAACLAPFTNFAASAVAQLALGRLGQRRLLTLGTLLFPAGLILTAVSLYRPALWLFLTAAALAGAGAGLLFKGAVSQSAMAAEPASRAGVLATFFVIAYIGMGVPSIAFSIVIQHADLGPTMIGFAAILSAGAIAAVTTAIRTSR
jgi:MFS family permease